MRKSHYLPGRGSQNAAPGEKAAIVRQIRFFADPFGHLSRGPAGGLRDRQHTAPATSLAQFRADRGRSGPSGLAGYRAPRPVRRSWFYFPGDGNWWLGTLDVLEMQWTFAGNTLGFGQVGDGRPFWVADLSR